MYSDIDWGKVGNKEVCMANSSIVAACARRFREGLWSFLGPGLEEKWYRTHIHKPNGSWNDLADLMMLHLRESGHRLFRRASALFRGALLSTGGGRTSLHYNADPATTEMWYFAKIFPPISSVPTEHWRTGVKNLLSRFRIILYLEQGIVWPR